MESEHEILCDACGVSFIPRYRHGQPPTAPPKGQSRCSICRARDAESRRTDARPNYTGDVNEYRSPMACDFPAGRNPYGRNPYGRNPYGRKPNDQRGHREANRNPSAQQEKNLGARTQHQPRRAEFVAVCANCGATAHVPFEPSRFQQVLCRACHRENRENREKRALQSKSELTS